MHYYSTNRQSPLASLEEAVVRGLATDKGLYMPEQIKKLPKEFYDDIAEMSFQEIAYRVADAFFGEDIPAEELKHIVYDTLAFDAPVVHVDGNIHSLELYHGPTLAFKDVGARFMARMLGYFNGRQSTANSQQNSLVNVLVATSGDTGSAVANGFLGVEGIHVYVLYPKGKVSAIQEAQFTTLGQNITAIEMKQTMAKTLHVADREMLWYITAPRKRQALPTAVAPSQQPCMRPWRWAGATFDTNERPRGEMNSSATVRMK